MKMQKTLFVVLIVAFLSTLMVAQGSTAKITGKVLSADGTAIPGVLVTATSPKMVGKTVAVSDENGVYRLLNLKSGTYTLTYALDGFATMVRKNVLLKIEQTIRIPVKMELKKLKDTITVEGSAPLIDVKSAAQGKDINKEIFDALPKGRDFTSLVSTIPGVSTENRLLGGISVEGASGSENVYFLDGVDVTNIQNGQKGQGAKMDFVEEVQVKSSGYMAEFGGSLGGVISAVMRSGGNEFHGDLLLYYSGSALNGADREFLKIDEDDTTKAKYYTPEEFYGNPTYTKLAPGLSLGGYFIKNKVWFFGSVLPRSEVWENDFTYTETGTKATADTHTTKYTGLNYMLKVSAQLLSSVRFTGSYNSTYAQQRGHNAYHNRAWGPRGNEEENFDEYGYDWPSFSASAALDITVGNNAMLNIRGGMFSWSQENNQTPAPDSPRYSFYTSALGNYTGGGNTMFPEIPKNLQHGAWWSNYGYWTGQMLIANKQTKSTLSGDFTLYFNLAGEHSIKLGAVYTKRTEDVNNGWATPKIYIGWDMDAMAYGDNYGRGKYGYYVVRGNDETGGYGPVYEAGSDVWALYIQDSWTIGEKFTLNVGVRAEAENIPSYSKDPEFSGKIPIDLGFKDKIAPRLGFVYDVNGDSSLKVYGSFGLFYDVTKLNLPAGLYGGDNWYDAAYTMPDWDFTKIGVDNYYPGELLYVFNMRTPAFDTTDPDIKPMYQSNISLGVEKKISDELSLSVRVVKKHLIRAIEDVGVLTTEGETYFIANPGYGFTLRESDGGKFEDKYPGTPKAKREYLGINVSLEKRFSNNWMGGITYTYSNLNGNYSGLASSDEDGRVSPNTTRYFDLWYMSYDKHLNPSNGNLPTDRPHEIKAYGNYRFPFGLTLGTVFNISSGTPVSEKWVLDAEIYANGRGNLGRTPTFYNADLFASYNLKLGKMNLELSVNIDNVFNFKIAQEVMMKRNQGALSYDEATFLAGKYEYPADATPDPTYKLPGTYTEPISARLGIKLSF